MPGAPLHFPVHGFLFNQYKTQHQSSEHIPWFVMQLSKRIYLWLMENVVAYVATNSSRVAERFAVTLRKTTKRMMASGKYIHLELRECLR